MVALDRATTPGLPVINGMVYHTKRLPLIHPYTEPDSLIPSHHTTPNQLPLDGGPPLLAVSRPFGPVFDPERLPLEWNATMQTT